MKPEEIKVILADHFAWIRDNSKGKRANLCNADMRDANLRCADLCNANLLGADMRNADLRDADLHYANLCNANLCNANLLGANLRDADMRGVVLDELGIAILSIVPECGEFTAFKKTSEGVVELRIPAHAKRSNATGRKCRASEAVVVSLPDGCDVAHSLHDNSFVYKKNKTVKPREPFCEDRWQECASGIHFYITRAEADAHCT